MQLLGQAGSAGRREKSEVAGYNARVAEDLQALVYASSTGVGAHRGCQVSRLGPVRGSGPP